MKKVSTQASLDLYRDVIRHLASKGIQTNRLFLGGWSQGGINTTAFLEALESQGVKVHGAFTASAPNDPLAAFNAFVFHPQKSDTFYFAPLLAQTVFACEAYGGPKGLVKETLNPAVYTEMKGIYERSYGDIQNLLSLLKSWENKEKTSFLQPSLRNPAAFAASSYGQCLARNEAFRRDVQTNLHMYYGTIDPIIRPAIGRLAADYQLAVIGTPEARQKSKVVAIPVEGGSHRLTFITGSVNAKAWMDQLR